MLWTHAIACSMYLLLRYLAVLRTSELLRSNMDLPENVWILIVDLRLIHVIIQSQIFLAE